MQKNEHLELSKHDFIAIMNEAKVTMKPKAPVEEAKGGGKGGAAKQEQAKKGEEEKKDDSPKFDDKDIADAIRPAFSFDEDQLGYVDFLEAIVRVTDAYPFSEMDKADAGVLNFENKVEKIVERLGIFKSIEDVFAAKMNTRTMEMGYQPRVVVDEDDESDYDNMDG
jgi:hypothetical protein